MTNGTAIRTTIPTRRGHTVIVLHHEGQKFHIGFGQVLNAHGRIAAPAVVEVFADTKQTGSGQQAMLSDGCIAISLLIQYGVPIAQIAEAFGEIRNEGEDRGRPASILGVIARVGAALEKEDAR